VPALFYCVLAMPFLPLWLPIFADQTGMRKLKPMPVARVSVFWRLIIGSFLKLNGIMYKFVIFLHSPQFYNPY
jgi:hypothetical protein